jgi:hypothetical protein
MELEETLPSTKASYPDIVNAIGYFIVGLFCYICSFLLFCGIFSLLMPYWI